ncbi:hypothetical protein M408DRAFT_143042 [Serendipita vermifera MAFF 305830]|uniref:Uncharacterized protein n=1 Tax=Serendipita vermifera MAFF 305830 TaxID=933852 RepID=A0A0C3A6N6_SERVB|nr:hypothetical protein M408DRAFT_143042 [Serendipita vermifera MAFF 305830]
MLIPHSCGGPTKKPWYYSESVGDVKECRRLLRTNCFCRLCHSQTAIRVRGCPRVAVVLEGNMCTHDTARIACAL